jgi:aminomethyltransferase
MMMVVNASNRTKVVEWLTAKLLLGKSWRSVDDTTYMYDDTKRTAMIALQGPKAVDVLAPIVEAGRQAPPPDIRTMRHYHYSHEYFDGILSRTGYTGEDGFEIICRAEHACEIWDLLIQSAEKVGGSAAGLGARDTLRLEAAMPLYGHELTEQINPLQAGLGFAVNLGGRDFVGREALERVAAESNQPVRVGLQLDGRRVPRQGCAVLQDRETVGEVTSGTFSPTFERPIAMAYVQRSVQSVPAQLAVDIRGTKHPAVVVPLPFYRRKK